MPIAKIAEFPADGSNGRNYTVEVWAETKEIFDEGRDPVATIERRRWLETWDALDCGVGLTIKLDRVARGHYRDPASGLELHSNDPSAL